MTTEAGSICEATCKIEVNGVVYDIAVQMPAVAREKQIPVVLTVILPFEPHVRVLSRDVSGFPLELRFEITGGTPENSSAEIADPDLIREYPITPQVLVQRNQSERDMGLAWVTNNPIIGVDDLFYEISVSVPESMAADAQVMLTVPIGRQQKARVIHENSSNFRMSAVPETRVDGHPLRSTATATEPSIPVHVSVQPITL